MGEGVSLGYVLLLMTIHAVLVASMNVWISHYKTKIVELVVTAIVLFVSRE